MHIVLLEPEIPPNTGNVARLCAATGSTLHLVEPLGFKLDDTQLKRAGMDYWQHAEWHRWPSWTAFQKQVLEDACLWLVESKGPRLYTEVSFAPNDYLVFGRETAGLPKKLLRENPEHWLRIPMFNTQARSLNLSNCVALVLFEALRQQALRGGVGGVVGEGWRLIRPAPNPAFRTPHHVPAVTASSPIPGSAP